MRVTPRSANRQHGNLPLFIALFRFGQTNKHRRLTEVIIQPTATTPASKK
jgi:hypothetical protein